MTTVTARPQRGALLHQLVSEEVRAWMARRRVSGEALAEKLGTSGTFVSRRLLGKTAFDLNDIEAIAAALGVDPHELLAPALAEHQRQSATRAADPKVTSRRCRPNAGQSIAPRVVLPSRPVRALASLASALGPCRRGGTPHDGPGAPPDRCCGDRGEAPIGPRPRAGAGPGRRHVPALAAA